MAVKEEEEEEEEEEGKVAAEEQQRTYDHRRRVLDLRALVGLNQALEVRPQGRGEPREEG